MAAQFTGSRALMATTQATDDSSKTRARCGSTRESPAKKRRQNHGLRIPSGFPPVDCERFCTDFVEAIDKLRNQTGQTPHCGLKLMVAFGTATFSPVVRLRRHASGSEEGPFVLGVAASSWMALKRDGDGIAWHRIHHVKRPVEWAEGRACICVRFPASMYDVLLQLTQDREQHCESEHSWHPTEKVNETADPVLVRSMAAASCSHGVALELLEMLHILAPPRGDHFWMGTVLQLEELGFEPMIGKRYLNRSSDRSAKFTRGSDLRHLFELPTASGDLRCRDPASTRIWPIGDGLCNRAILYRHSDGAHMMPYTRLGVQRSLDAHISWYFVEDEWMRCSYVGWANYETFIMSGSLQMIDGQLTLLVCPPTSPPPDTVTSFLW